MISLSLPVRDLSRARAFYEGLGFRINANAWQVLWLDQLHVVN